jgi:hypothetical protein
MDRIISRYEKLFSIHFSHPEYPSSGPSGGVLGGLLSLQPDETTRRLFKAHDIHFKVRQDHLLCFVRIRTDADIPYFRLPSAFSARFLLQLREDLARQTEVQDTHGKENMYRFRINVRAAANAMNLTGASLGTILSRDPVREFTEGEPGTWTTTFSNLSGHFGAIDIVTEGSSTHRLYSDVSNQVLNYTPANGREHEHLFTIQFSI